MKPASKSAYRLMHEGTLALAQIEHHGMRIDERYLNKAIKGVEYKIGQLTARLKQDEIYETWERTYGSRTTLGSREQLGHVLFDKLGHPCSGRTKPTKRYPEGRPKVDAESLERLGLKFVKRYLQIEKLKKLKSTYLKGILREVVDGYLRPSFNLHFVVTYRSSCDSPNSQNIPKRDDRLAALVRRAFIPRPGHVLVEADYSGHEFRIAACFWKDPAMVEYASDPAKDIHRDVAAECFLLPADDVPGDVRYCAKSRFVFAELYGDWYVNCARNLLAEAESLKTPDGRPLGQHLTDRGIGTPERFEAHIKRVEKRFHGWFPLYAERKEKWWDSYKRKGHFRLMTGFVCQGVYSRNKVYNYPVQGPAFHCLLWSLVKLNRWLTKSKMRSMIVGQIHDSLLMDVHRDELDEVMAKTKQVMTVDLRRAWPWIIVPLSIEAELSEKNWHEKKELAI